MLSIDQNIGFLLHDISRLMRHRFDVRARDLGVTRPQWRALVHLARNPGSTQSELAELLDVEQITLCRMIDRLTDAGLVERRPDARDRRVRRLHLLPPAIAIVDDLAAIGAVLEEEVLAPLDLAEQAQFARSVTRILDGLRRPAGEQPRRQVA
ncbi:MAG: MarR family transcriptional regulator [Sphingomonas bacterium]|jgi:MarR family transcriptional regulator for hemolysin|nr:MarR family transcriptional regulator [Sphingomonas bacterium]MDB5690299.1 MarR family transcriptional regulator [Sphingomonas bacterium]